MRPRHQHQCGKWPCPFMKLAGWPAKTSAAICRACRWRIIEGARSGGLLAMPSPIAASIMAKSASCPAEASITLNYVAGALAEIIEVFKVNKCVSRAGPVETAQKVAYQHAAPSAHIGSAAAFILSKGGYVRSWRIVDAASAAILYALFGPAEIKAGHHQSRQAAQAHGACPVAPEHHKYHQAIMKVWNYHAAAAKGLM